MSVDHISSALGTQAAVTLRNPLLFFRPLSRRDRFFAEECWRLAAVIRTETYVDTVMIWMPRAPSDPVLHRLWVLNGKRHKIELKQCKGFGFTFTMHRPTAEAKAFVAQLKHTVARFDTALDLITRTAAQAQSVDEFMHRFLYHPYRHAGRHRSKVETTSYFSDDPHSTRNVAVYSDRMSKIAEMPCCHVEFRNRSGTCRTLGVKHIADLGKLDLKQVIMRCGRIGALDRPSAREALYAVMEHHERLWGKEWTRYEHEMLMLRLHRDLNLTGRPLRTIEETIELICVQDWLDYRLLRAFMPSRLCVTEIGNVLETVLMIRAESSHPGSVEFQALSEIAS